MIATLRGRWQTRLYLLLIVGGVVTFPFALYGAFVSGSLAGYVSPYVILLLVLLLGFGWDVVYNLMQKMTWEHDWPPVLQILTAVAEANVVWLVMQGWNGIAPRSLLLGVTAGAFVAHYVTVWTTTFLFSQSGMRLFFPRWRFHGGEIWD